MEAAAEVRAEAWDVATAARDSTSSRAQTGGARICWELAAATEAAAVREAVAARAVAAATEVAAEAARAASVTAVVAAMDWAAAAEAEAATARRTRYSRHIACRRDSARGCTSHRTAAAERRAFVSVCQCARLDPQINPAAPSATGGRPLAKIPDQ